MRKLLVFLLIFVAFHSRAQVKAGG
ncbi:MAG: hypothetical protein K0S12_1998, partial [Bacteroidetes bacterium]|nr:hypothetical protein [Bacteroidota bacterium]